MSNYIAQKNRLLPKKSHQKKSSKNRLSAFVLRLLYIYIDMHLILTTETFDLLIFLFSIDIFIYSEKNSEKELFWSV